MTNSEFTFELDVHRQHFVRNGFFLILFGIIVGGILGTIFYYILEYTNIENQYVILGIGAGIGLAFGIVLGISLIISMKAKIVPDFGSTYGVGIGTNIFIGAIIGTVFGAVVGSLFGLILQATDYIIDTNLSYPVYGMLIWIVLGLNVGVLIGLITSFGSIDIIAGGAIAGIIVGLCGSLAIFGPDWIAAGGVAAGFVVGLVISIFTKYSIRASMGFITQPMCGGKEIKDQLDKGIDDNTRRTRVVHRNRYRGSRVRTSSTSSSRRRRYRSDSYHGDPCFGPTYTTSYACGNSDDSGDCGGDGDSDCGQAVAPIILMVLLAGAVILLITFISWISVKASTKFGGVVKKGALTAFGSSASILLIIGCNIGLTASFHQLEVYYLALIGAGLALFIGLLIISGQTLSMKMTSFTIAPGRIKWKDGTTQGNLSLANVERYDFVVQLDDKKNVAEYEGHVKFYLKNGTASKVCISCWKTPEDTISSRYLQTILLHFLNQIEEIRVQEKVHQDRISETTILQESSKPIRRTYRESFASSKVQVAEEEVRKQVSEKEISDIRDLVEARDKMSVNWISRVTRIPEFRVIDIATILLGKSYENGFIVPAKPPEKAKVGAEFTEKQIQKVQDLVEARKKVRVTWLSDVTGLSDDQVIKIATEYLGKLLVSGYIISDDIFE
ncbi:MAG: hypothetical protein ACTSPM_07435 [Candidatus Heimdallarchaeota archaeon]